jgi:hypothetical protein
MRYNGTARVGVIKTDQIITENIGWIFREQPIADVGIDAIIEQVENGEPTGKFIAVQIKTGIGNFHKSEKSLILYVSHIHYNYWLNLCIPIILVAYLPEDNITLWQELNANNFKKTKKRWKIEIPFTQSFSEKSKNRLIKILSIKGDKNFDIYNGVYTPENEFDVYEKIQGIVEATNSLFKIKEILNEQTEKIKQTTIKVESFVNQRLFMDSPQVISLYNGLSVNLNITSSRLENEIHIFSQVYADGIFAFEKILLLLKQNGIIVDLLIDNQDYKVLKTVPVNIIYAVDMMTKLKDSIFDLNINNVNFKISKSRYIEVIDLIIGEMNDAKDITESLLLNFES